MVRPGVVAEHLAAAESPDAIRHPIPGPPPLVGAQWDELRGVWIRWIEDAWVVVEDGPDGVDLAGPIEDVVLPATLARDLVVARTLDLRRPGVVVDLVGAEPTVRVPGAQWNEVRRRWEEWDENAGAWVKAAIPL